MLGPYKLLADGKDDVVVLAAAAKLKVDELQAAADLSIPALEHLRSWTIAKAGRYGVLFTLCLGGALAMWQAAVLRKNRREQFVALCEELEISETRAYDAINIFQGVGNELLSRPELVVQFSVESLKRLTLASASPNARDAAFELAKSGERITIKRAEELLAEHPCKLVEIAARGGKHSAAPRARKTRRAVRRASVKPLWTYAGQAARLVIEPVSTDLTPSPTALIGLLEAALEELRREWEEGGCSDSIPEVA